MSKFFDKLRLEQREKIIKSYKDVFSKNLYPLIEKVLDEWIAEGNVIVDFERADWKKLLDDITDQVKVKKCSKPNKQTKKTKSKRKKGK
jgi:hypothetical protein